MLIFLEQDLDEDCRRLCEGKSRPNECDVAYLNGKLRLEEVSKGCGKSLRLLEEIRKLHRPDASSIAEVRRSISISMEVVHIFKFHIHIFHVSSISQISQLER